MTPQEMLEQEFSTVPVMIRLHAEHQPETIALALDERRVNYR